MLKAALRLAVAAALVAGLVAILGTADVAHLVGRLDWRWIALGLALVQVQIVLSALRWRFTAGRLGLAVAPGRAVGEYYLSSLANMVLPGGVAGDVLRTIRSAPSRATLAAAVRAAVMERISGQVAFWTIAAAGLALWIVEGMRTPLALAAALAVVPLVLAAAAAGLAFAARFGPAAVRAALAGLRPDLRRVFLADGALGIQAALSYAVAASYVAVFAVAAAAIGSPLTLVHSVTLVPLVLLAMLLPVSFGGWGLREGAAALLWPLAGLPAAEGAVAAALYGLMVLAGALPGLAVLVSPASSAGNAPEAA